MVGDAGSSSDCFEGSDIVILRLIESGGECERMSVLAETKVL